MSGQMIEFPSNGGNSRGYLAVPPSGSGPGVIVLQEWWGLVDHIKRVADRFAEAGFVALAPDLYHGESTEHPDDAGRMMMALEIDRTEKDLRGAIDYLLSRPETSSSKVGTVGFCMGGQLSLYAACENASVGACVDYYGIHPSVAPDLSKLAAPVLGFFGETDEFVTPAAARELEQALAGAGKQAEIHIYSGTGHAFFNDSRPDAYDAEHAADSWSRMLAFYGRHLDT
jgi:carboxymethylenebutenolidase